MHCYNLHTIQLFVIYYCSIVLTHLSLVLCYNSYILPWYYWQCSHTMQQEGLCNGTVSVSSASRCGGFAAVGPAGRLAGGRYRSTAACGAQRQSVVQWSHTADRLRAERSCQLHIALSGDGQLFNTILTCRDCTLGTLLQHLLQYCMQLQSLN